MNDFNLSMIKDYKEFKLCFSSFFYQFNDGRKRSTKVNELIRRIKKLPKKDLSEFFDALVKLPEFAYYFSTGTSGFDCGSLQIHIMMKMDNVESLFFITIPMSETKAFNFMRKDEKDLYYRTQESVEILVKEKRLIEKYVSSLGAKVEWHTDERGFCTNLI